MFERWRRWRMSGRDRATARQPTRPGSKLAEPGPTILLERRDGKSEVTEILAALGERYKVSAQGSDSSVFEVVVDDAVYPDEAVVRLASIMDEIDTDWQQQISWPRMKR